jgi:hypothetical protein
MEATRSSETSVVTRPTRRRIPEDGNLNITTDPKLCPLAWNLREEILGYIYGLTQLQNLFLFPRRPKVIQLSTQTEREVTGRMIYSSETVASRWN